MCTSSPTSVASTVTPSPGVTARVAHQVDEHESIPLAVARQGWSRRSRSFSSHIYIPILYTPTVYHPLTLQSHHCLMRISTTRRRARRLTPRTPTPPMPRPHCVQTNHRIPPQHRRRDLVADLPMDGPIAHGDDLAREARDGRGGVAAAPGG